MPNLPSIAIDRGKTVASASNRASTASVALAVMLRPVATVCYGGFTQPIGLNVSPSPAISAQQIAPTAGSLLQMGHLMANLQPNWTARLLCDCWRPAEPGASKLSP
jgi:hypothetical protein